MINHLVERDGKRGDIACHYIGSVLIVAHDRYFLDKIVTKIIEIDNSAVTVFSGNYTDYAAKKAVLRNMKLKEYLNQQRDDVRL